MSDYQQLVVDTFLGPIKNVLVIDDEFPCYDIISQKKARKALDTAEREVFLISFSENAV